MESLQSNELSMDDIDELEEKRVHKLVDAGINEEDVLGKAKTNLNIWEGYFNENMTRGKDDLNFALRDQWTAIERSEFNRLQKVAFTANKLLDTTNKLCGQQRKNKPDLIVRSLNGKSTQQQIDLRADIVRTISYQSQNDLIYQTAFKNALYMGWGAFQIDVDYESPYSFNKIIKYLMLPDVQRLSFDPMALKPHKGDGDYCSRQFVFSKEQFTANYPYVINPVSYADPRMLLDFQWETRDTIVVCDYYVKEWYSFKLLKLSNGESVTEDKWEEIKKYNKLRKELAVDSDLVKDAILSLNPTIIGERVTQDYHLMHYRLIKDRILDFSVWPSKHLPIIFVDGNSHYIEGRQYTHSFIREARDTQKYLNYLLSERATEVKNRRREQWIGTPDNIVGYEQMWRNPESQLGILIAKPDPQTRMMPTKSPPWQLSPELLSESQMCTQDLREIMGFSESQDLQGRDVSGKARRERQIEGSMAAYVYFDNLNQAIEQGGRVVLDLLPHVYGEDERYMAITKKDGKTDNIILNQRNMDGSIDNEISVGEYDIEIDTGPSFAVQKEVALEFLQQTLQTFPQAFPLVADLWAKNLDVQFMPQIAERFKTMVPPEILAQEEGKPMPPKPPSPQEQALQMEMELKQAELKEKETELQLRQQKYELEKEKQQLEKFKMILEAKKTASEMKNSDKDRRIDIHKADLNYSSQIAKVMADLHKHSNKPADNK